MNSLLIIFINIIADMKDFIDSLIEGGTEQIARIVRNCGTKFVWVEIEVSSEKKISIDIQIPSCETKEEYKKFTQHAFNENPNSILCVTIYKSDGRKTFDFLDISKVPHEDEMKTV